MHKYWKQIAAGSLAVMLATPVPIQAAIKKSIYVGDVVSITAADLKVNKPNTSCYDYYTFQDLEEACIRAKTLSLTEFPVSLLYEPIETEDGWRMKEIFIYMKGRAIASERIRLHCSFYLRAGHKLN